MLFGGTRMLAVAVVLVLTWATSAAADVVAPQAPITHYGRWMLAADGRVFVSHGVNVPTKELPAYPAGIDFGEDDAQLLQDAGLNTVRLTVERYAVEPIPGVFDDGYLAQMRATVQLLAAHGIVSLIDFHQDEYGPVFFDNGFPDWMTQSDGLPNLYQVGFPYQYLLNPALNRAFDHFWANDRSVTGRGLQDEDAAILARTAQALKGQANLLGYEVMNEPWPGTAYPTCLLLVVGCPLFDKGPFSAYTRKAIGALRGADPEHLIWYEPLVTFNYGIPTWVQPPVDPRLGFAFHLYPLCTDLLTMANLIDQLGAACSAESALTYANALAHAKATGNALLETEFGNTTDPVPLDRELGEDDALMIPWTFWAYTSHVLPYDSNGDLLPATAGNVHQQVLAALARPYPQLVAGTPLAWSYDPASKRFSLRYTNKRVDAGYFGAGAETDVSVPQIAYPGGYHATATGADVVSAPNAPMLRLRAKTGASTIAVTVTP